MNQDFMNRFIPKINAILLRDENFWQGNDYQAVRTATQVCNMGFILSGSGTLEIRDMVYPLQKGCFYQLSPIGSSIRMTSSLEAPLVYLAIHFDYRLMQWEGMELSIQEAKTGLPLPHVTELASASDAEARFRKLYHMWTEKQAGYEWRSRIALTELLSDIEGMQGQQHLPDTKSDELMKSAMMYVNKQFHNPMSRDAMAKQCAMSVSYFSVLFKKYTGYSYVQYIHKVRLDRAKVLLRSSYAPISEIAREIGYEDPLYFSKMFMREVGLSPREYRKE
ncbi:AraC family transcriptional regulator [Paenibacillus roseipurpureus]|uniref:AraC family transcriptional regulator n=1 Tax=Paenibacillus roseopurpureus TaxID=2918901 RepID=A0AA96LQC7_9BACL|nr:AraC family transcriptional regulator [Paenibacillus sp. MBLB1832]WNR46065.1 AraC family transcriptional regulator [Paenibacillus sp. MBLB1832]